MENKYTQGLFFNRKRENAPDWVLGSISIQKERFLEWINGVPANEKGYIYINVNESKDGKSIYTQLNDYKAPEKKEYSTIPNKAKEIAKTITPAEEVFPPKEDDDLGF